MFSLAKWKLREDMTDVYVSGRTNREGKVLFKQKANLAQWQMGIKWIHLGWELEKDTLSLKQWSE